MRRKFDAFQEATVGVFGAPPVEGLGSTGGIKLQIQDKRDAGLRALQGAVQATADEGQRQPGIAALFSTFSVNQPQIFVEIDRDKAKAQSVSLDDVNNTLQSYLGSYYVNDFTFQNRNWQVNVQADPKYRMRVEDIGRLEVRNAKGDRVPAGHADPRQEHLRAGHRQPLQPLSLGRDHGHPGPGHQFPPGDRDHGPRGRAINCPPRWATSGPS